VYVLGLASGAGSYSKIKVVRYHTMDLAYSARNQELFFLETRSWGLRVWYVGKGRSVRLPFIYYAAFNSVRQYSNETSI